MMSNEKIEYAGDDLSMYAERHTTTPQVRILSQNFEIPQLGCDRRIWIYLPTNYELSQQHYPVIYMQDGQNLFDEFTASYAEWHVDEIMESLPPNEQCIIVGIDHAGENRITEYNPFDSEHGKGKGNDYTDFLAQTLKPFVDSNYRTRPQPQYTAIAGSSMGGLITMFAALKYPQVFGHAGVFSPAFWIAPQIYEAALNTPLPPGARFYFVCGDAESETMVSDVQAMAAIIRDKNISDDNCPVTIIEGAGHDEQQWQHDFWAFYEWLKSSF